MTAAWSLLGLSELITNLGDLTIIGPNTDFTISGDATMTQEGGVVDVVIDRDGAPPTRN